MTMLLVIHDGWTPWAFTNMPLLAEVGRHCWVGMTVLLLNHDGWIPWAFTNMPLLAQDGRYCWFL